MRREKFFLLFLLTTVLLGVFTLAWVNVRGTVVEFDPIFDLPNDIPYIYVELDETTLGKPEGRLVVFLYIEDGGINCITAAAKDGQWELGGSSDSAHSRIEHYLEMHSRRVRPVPAPSDRAHLGKIFASDGGAMSLGAPVAVKGEVFAVGNDEWETRAQIFNLDLILSRARETVPIRQFPQIDGKIYGHVAANLALFDFLGLSGEFYASIADGNARWEGIAVPAVLSRFYFGKKELSEKFFRQIFDTLQNRYELSSSHGGFHSPAPLSLWLTEAKEFVEIGIIDENKIAGEAPPSPMTERAILWAQFSPPLLVGALDRSVAFIKPKFSIKKALENFTNFESITISLNSLRRASMKWKVK